MLEKATINKKRHWTTYLYFALFILISSLIIYLSLQSGDTSIEQSGYLVTLLEKILNIFNVDLDERGLGQLTMLVRKIIGHFGLFFVDGIFAYLAFNNLFYQDKRQGLIASISAIIIIAITSELLQNFAEGRAMQIADMIIDISGGVLAITIVYFIEYFFLKRRVKS